MKVAPVVAILGLLSSAMAQAEPVGEVHRIASEPTAILRDAMHRDQLRITVWYPAASGSVESRIVVGPPTKPLFDVGTAAMDAPFAADPARRPVILLSHGFGGSARIMGWFGIAMARRGDVVIAVDHPGSNALDGIDGAPSFKVVQHIRPKLSCRNPAACDPRTPQARRQ